MNGTITRSFTMLLLLAGEVTGQNIVKARMQVEAHVARERYCSVGSDSATLLITFDARVGNSSNSPIELSLPSYPVARVSSNLVDARNHKYEAVLHVPLMEMNKDATPKPSSPITVMPGENFEFKTMEVTFPLSLRAKANRAGDLGFGIHFVELEFEARDGGTKHFLINESQPIQIEIKKTTRLKPCS